MFTQRYDFLHEVLTKLAGRLPIESKEWIVLADCLNGSLYPCNGDYFRIGLILPRHARCSLIVFQWWSQIILQVGLEREHAMSVSLPDARQLSDEVLQALRLRALRGCELGYTESEVAELLGLSRETVSRWWTAYAEDGVEALPGERTGRPPGSGRTLNEGQAAYLRTILNEKTPEDVGIAAPLWTRRAVAELIRKEYGIDMSVWTVGEYLLAGATRPRCRVVVPRIRTPRRFAGGWRRPIRRSSSGQPARMRTSTGATRPAPWPTSSRPGLRPRGAAGEDRRARPPHPDEHDLDDQQRGIGPFHDLQADDDSRAVHHVLGAPARRDDSEDLPDRGSAEGP